MNLERKKNIENFIEDWHWDAKSHQFAFELCAYLFDFVDYLKEKGNLKEKTIRKHQSNCWSIGILISRYGYHEKFTPQILAYPPYHDIEFRRKMGDSKYQISSYESTCNKLEKYAIKKGHLNYEK